MTVSQYFRLINIHARMLLKVDANTFKLGFLWWFLEPLMWVGVFYVVFNLILDSRKGGDFMVFLTCGKFAFIWFSKTVIQASYQREPSVGRRASSSFAFTLALGLTLADRAECIPRLNGDGFGRIQRCGHTIFEVKRADLHLDVP